MENKKKMNSHDDPEYSKEIAWRDEYKHPDNTVEPQKERKLVE